MRALFAATVATLLAASTPPPRRVDAPLGSISCDLLPIKAPTPLEAGDDEQTKPYHVLVRVFFVPSLAPDDVPIEWLELRGAGRSRRVAPGEYLFDDVPIGYTTLTLSDGSSSEISTSVGPMKRRNVLAGRNPLVLARWATTVCELFVLDPAHADDSTKFRGAVVDRADAKPVAGATVWCAGKSALTGSDGRFEVAEPVTWRDLLTKSRVDADGLDSCVLSTRPLLGAWVRRLVTGGEATFVLGRSGPPPPGLLPRLAPK